MRTSVTISNRRVRTRTHGGVAGVSGQPLPLCRSNALVSRDLANFLVGYTEVTRWGNAERRVLCRSFDWRKNVVLIVINRGKMRTKGE